MFSTAENDYFFKFPDPIIRERNIIMFFIHTLEGLYRDLTLEALIHKTNVSGVTSNSRTRKLLRGESDSHGNTPEGRTMSYAEKSYRQAVNIKNELEPIFHAYQIMSSPVKTLQPGMKITDAWALFNREKVHHMPVVNNAKNIEGIVSVIDLLKRLIITDDKISNQTDEIISDIMIKEVVTASRVTDIRRIAMVMFTMHIGTMPILDDDKNLIGIITRSDILHAMITYPPLKLWG